MHPLLLLHHELPELLVEDGDKYLGPATLLAAYRWIAEQPRRKHRRAARCAGDPFKLYRCHTIMNCTQTCPKGLNPAQAIASIKQLLVDRRA